MRIHSLVLRNTWHYVIIRLQKFWFPKFVFCYSNEAALRKGVTTAYVFKWLLNVILSKIYIVSSFWQFNVTKATTKVTDWQQAAGQLKQVLPQGDQVLAHWYRLLSDFKQDLPLLQKLSSDCLKVGILLTQHYPMPPPPFNSHIHPIIATRYPPPTQFYNHSIISEFWARNVGILC